VNHFARKITVIDIPNIYERRTIAGIFIFFITDAFFVTARDERGKERDRKREEERKREREREREREGVHTSTK